MNTRPEKTVIMNLIILAVLLGHMYFYLHRAISDHQQNMKVINNSNKQNVYFINLEVENHSYSAACFKLFY